MGGSLQSAYVSRANNMTETGAKGAGGDGRGRGLQLVMADRLRHPQI